MDNKNFEKMVNQTFNFNISDNTGNNSNSKSEDEHLITAKDILDVSRNLVTFIPICSYFLWMIFYGNFKSNYYIFGSLISFFGIFFMLSAISVVYAVKVCSVTWKSKSKTWSRFGKMGKIGGGIFIVIVLLAIVISANMFIWHSESYSTIFKNSSSIECRDNTQ